MKKAVLFDIDGTILNAWDFVNEAVKHAFVVHNYPFPSDEDLREAMGKPIVEYYESFVSPDEALKLIQTHRAFQEKNFDLIKPFPNTKKTLKRLKDSGFLIAAVSNRSRESLVPTLKMTGFLKLFDAVVASDDVKNPKPHQDHILAALEVLQVEPINSYMVGDTEKDILAGKNAKVKTVGVTYGWLGKDIAQTNPDFMIDNIDELLRIIK